jgi:hypothetical protein
VNYKKSALQVAMKGHIKYEKSLVEAEQKLNATKSKQRALLDEEKATYELGNFVTLYKNNERAFASSPLPRYEYDIQGARLKASRGGKENVSNELRRILSTKCPTWQFTLEDFFATHSLDITDSRRQLVNKRKQPTMMYLNNLLDDPASLALHLFGAVVMTPIKGALYAISVAWDRYGIEFPEPVDESQSEGEKWIGVDDMLFFDSASFSSARPHLPPPLSPLSNQHCIYLQPDKFTRHARRNCSSP